MFLDLAKYDSLISRRHWQINVLMTTNGWHQCLKVMECLGTVIVIIITVGFFKKRNVSTNMILNTLQA